MAKVNDNTLWKWFSMFIRLRDAAPFTGICRCVTCGAPYHWRQMDCGHYIPRQHKATKYNEKNNHAQCAKCNCFEGGRMDLHAKAIDRMYGPGTADLLNVLSKGVAKYGQFEIDAFAAHYRAQAQALAKQKSLGI